MFCGKCGTQLAETQKFCPKCGTAVTAQPAQPAQAQPVYQQPVQPVYTQPVQPVADMPMKWFKWLIYFVLFAGALINLGQAGMYLTGSMYEPNTEKVYEEYESLQSLDMCMGVIMIGIAVLQICTRFALAGYRKSGPGMLYACYAAGAASNVLYYIALLAMLPSEVTQYLNTSSLFSGVAISIGMISANITYFKKRAHLFVR